MVVGMFSGLAMIAAAIDARPGDISKAMASPLGRRLGEALIAWITALGIPDQTSLSPDIDASLIATVRVPRSPRDSRAAPSLRAAERISS